MQVTYERDIGAPPEVLWSALLTPAVLQACMPGCESVTGSPEAGYDAVVGFRLAGIRVHLSGRIIVTDMDPPHSLHITGEGKGGAAGLVRGGARVTLTPIPGGTRLGYEIDGAVEGRLSQISGRIVSGVAHRLADEFFARLGQSVGAPSPDAPEPPGGKGWFRRLAG
ncbi:carbon monoxide dehydrogenase subunit G [Tabrizicola sp. J26]|uniref:CoxG family protein n=1 Tax=Alitabrizicola rongguiensis TaxID=2909234 RepID=UPI001F32DE97|nr:carbon monoxide dehydrogenase subunit G [Tabrizicola rongguiensis]MCF1709841.1 carbon monoxide dehydrogenase subunit G [Tabrizicola rongguiensis]